MSQRKDALRTPDERFEALDGFPFDPHYKMVDGYRMHYLDEGPVDGPVVLMLHGEPTWSYLYRKMAPGLTAAGLRSIVPDLLGFGRSDKPKAMDTHTYAFHVSAISSLVQQLDLQDVTFFGQDWGGLIGLRVVAENEQRFARVMVSNTGLPVGEGTPSPAFENWKRMNQAMIDAGDMPVGGMLAQFTGDAALEGAYDAPFPDPSFKVGPLILPQRVPVSAEDPARPANLRAWEVFSRWEKPFMTAFGDSDPITDGGDMVFQKKIPGAAGQPHVTLEGAGHFLQETHGPELVRLLADFVERTNR